MMTERNGWQTLRVQDGRVVEALYEDGALACLCLRTASRGVREHDGRRRVRAYRVRQQHISNGFTMLEPA